MIVVAPAAVAATIASIMDFVPFAKLSNSKTPGGLSTSTVAHYCDEYITLEQKDVKVMQL